MSCWLFWLLKCMPFYIICFLPLCINNSDRLFFSKIRYTNRYCMSVGVLIWSVLTGITGLEVIFKFLFKYIFKEYKSQIAEWHYLDMLWFSDWQATKEFLEEIGLHYSDPDNEPLSWATAVKFLMARKFDVRRAVELFMSHEVGIDSSKFCFTAHSGTMKRLIWFVWGLRSSFSVRIFMTWLHWVTHCNQRGLYVCTIM